MTRVKTLSHCHSSLKFELSLALVQTWFSIVDEVFNGYNTDKSEYTDKNQASSD